MAYLDKGANEGMRKTDPGGYYQNTKLHYDHGVTLKSSFKNIVNIDHGIILKSRVLRILYS